MKLLFAYLALGLTTALFSVEQDSRPVATYVAIEAKVVRTESAKTAVARFTRTSSPTRGPSSTVSPTPEKGTASPTATLTTTRTR
jgi:hypothetical protein